MPNVASEGLARAPRSADAILSDQRIEELLQAAEAQHRQLAQKDNGEGDDDLIVLETAERKPKEKTPLPRLQHNLNTSTYIKSQDGVARGDPAAMVPAEQRKMADELRTLPTQTSSQRVNDQTTSGPSWFDLPKTKLTPALKRDLQIISLRNVLDPHRHYKKDSRKGKIPQFSQVGTVVEGPTEFFSGRINRKDRSKNFVEEAIKGEQENGRFKRKYSEIQNVKTSGKKAHYNKLMAKRRKR